MNGVTEDNVLKLDNFNTWIYRDTGEPVPDMGDEYNIYHALLDQLMNRNLNASNAYLATLGMYSPEKGATFTLRNRNIRVESVVRNAGNAALNKIKLQSKETPAAGYGDDELNQVIPPIGEETSLQKRNSMISLINLTFMMLKQRLWKNLLKKNLLWKNLLWKNLLWKTCCGRTCCGN
jgi:hypothetical protein